MRIAILMTLVLATAGNVYGREDEDPFFGSQAVRERDNRLHSQGRDNFTIPRLSSTTPTWDKQFLADYKAFNTDNAREVVVKIERRGPSGPLFREFKIPAKGSPEVLEDILENIKTEPTLPSQIHMVKTPITFEPVAPALISGKRLNPKDIVKNVGKGSESASAVVKAPVSTTKTSQGSTQAESKVALRAAVAKGLGVGAGALGVVGLIDAWVSNPTPTKPLDTKLAKDLQKAAANANAPSLDNYNTGN